MPAYSRAEARLPAVRRATLTHHPTSAPNHRLELRVLGGFQVLFDGVALPPFAYDKMRALLVYLALQRQQDHSREALADLLWGANDPVTARGNLRRTLSHLRQVLERPTGQRLFIVTRKTIRLVPDFRVDALVCDPRPGSAPGDPARQRQEDERLIALHGGEFMAGFALPGCAEFDQWLQARRELLRRAALAMLERLSSACEAADEHDRALRFTLAQMRLDVWNELVCRRAMRLHAACGQEAAALALFEAFGRVLQKELDLLPDAATRRLADEIRAAAAARGRSDCAAAALASGPSARPGRRQVSVLACELSMPGASDREEAMERLAAPRARALEVIGRMSGFPVVTQRGRLLAYFGYPQAQEGGAVRAVQAALALARAAPDGVRIRCGVHTGIIVTDDQVAVPDSIGETTQCADGLQSLAAPGQVVISRETHEIVAGYFCCQGLGPRQLADWTELAEVYQVDAASGARTRLEAASNLTPLAGRQVELARLGELLGQAGRIGAPRAVLLRGEAGIGKSRLLRAFQERSAGGRRPFIEMRCFPQYSQSPFFPLLALLQAEAGFSTRDSADLKSARIRRWADATCPAVGGEAVAAAASLLTADAEAGAGSALLQPEAQKTLTFAFLEAMLEGLASQRSAILSMEDLHWADPSTLQLLASLVRSKHGESFVLLLTARSEFAPPWPAAAVPVVELAPLPLADTRQLVVSLGGDLPPQTIEQILARADGVPLFAEELAKGARRAAWTSVPATLQDLLAARIDRLGPARHTAQVAATLGRAFSRELLGQVASGEAGAIASALLDLEEAGLIEAVDGSTLQFRHVLMQEVAYHSQTRADRRAVHGKVARVLEQHFPAIAAVRPELVAQHFAAAGEVPTSIRYWLRAGQRAVRVSANLEAVAHFGNGLQLLSTLPEGEERYGAEFALLAGLSPALHATQGYGSVEATRVASRLSELREATSGGPDLFISEWARLRNTLATRGPRGVAEEAGQLLLLAGVDPIRMQAARYVAAIAHFWSGEFEASRTAAEDALALYRPQQHAGMLELFGEDLAVSYEGHLSWALCFLGFTNEARAACTRMLAHARAMSHPKTLAMALLFASMLSRWEGRYGDTLGLSAETMAVTGAHGMSHWFAASEALNALAALLHAERPDPRDLQSLAARLSTSSPSYAALRLASLAQAHLHLHLCEQALALIAQAQAQAATSGSLQISAELQRLRGECLLGISPTNAPAAAACFKAAIAISRAQKSKMFELRAAASLASMRLGQGRGARFLRQLQMVRAWFAEGVESPDILAADRLLRFLDEKTGTG